MKICVEKLVQKARMRVQEYYAIDNYVNQLVSYYEKLRKED